MTFDEKELISARVAAQAARQHTIEKDVTINGERYQFEIREFPPHFSMTLPKSFEQLAAERAKLKFPSENRPKIILTNADTTVNIAFDCIKTQPEELQLRLKKYKAVMKKLHPSYVFFTESICEIKSGLEVACYDYRGSALDTDIYYLSFFTDLPTGELFGWFNCPVDSQSAWEPLVRQMIQTIKPFTDSEV